jgi:hypothetical protein
VEELVELAAVEELAPPVEAVEALDEAAAPPVPEVALLVVCAPPEPEPVPVAPVVATLLPHAGRKKSRIADEERGDVSISAVYRSLLQQERRSAAVMSLGAAPSGLARATPR